MLKAWKQAWKKEDGSAQGSTKESTKDSSNKNFPAPVTASIEKQASPAPTASGSKESVSASHKRARSTEVADENSNDTSEQPPGKRQKSNAPPNESHSTDAIHSRLPEYSEADKVDLRTKELKKASAAADFVESLLKQAKDENSAFMKEQAFDVY